MLCVITGDQRAGKTFYAVQCIIIDFLKTSSRPIYTNLPINPDYILRTVEKNPLKRAKYADRIKIFIDTKFGSLRDFERKNPNFFRSHRKNIISAVNIRRFWDYIERYSVIVFDEVYEYFGALKASARDSENMDTREQLLSFSRQHGHYETDIFLISHTLQDLDPFIRRGVNYLYHVQNSKYSNIFESKWTKGIKWGMIPLVSQFFIIRGYENQSKDYSDKWWVRSNQETFKCYNSFSNSSKIMKLGAAGDGSGGSLDTKIKGYQFRRFGGQALISGTVLLSLALGVFLFIKLVYSMAGVDNGTFKFFKPPPKKAENTENVEDENKEDDKKKKKSVKDEKPIENKTYSVSSRSNEHLFYSDGVKIRKGQIYNGFIIEKIGVSDVIVGVPGGGARYRIDFNGLRN